MWSMTQAKASPPMESEGVQFEIEPLESLDGVEMRAPPPPGKSLAPLRERLHALEKELDEVERSYEARLADLTKRLAQADAREAERKAALKDLISKLG